MAFLPKLLSFNVLVFLTYRLSFVYVGSNMPPLIFYSSFFLVLGDIPSSFSIFLILCISLDLADFLFIFKSGSVCLELTFMLESCLEFLLFITFGGLPPCMLLVLADCMRDRFELLSPLRLDILDTLLFSLLCMVLRVICAFKEAGGGLFNTESVNLMCLGCLLDLVVSI